MFHSTLHEDISQYEASYNVATNLIHIHSIVYITPDWVDPAQQEQ